MKEINTIIRSSKSEEAKIEFIMTKCKTCRENAISLLHPKSSASIRFSRIEAELLSRPQHPPMQSSRINIALYGGALVCRSD